MRAVSFCLFLLSILLFAGLACGGEEAAPTTVAAPTQVADAQATAAPESEATRPAAETSEPTTPAPTVKPTATTSPTEASEAEDPTPTAEATSTPQPTDPPQTTAAPADTPTPVPTEAPEETPAGTGAGPDSFIVGEESKITFTVEEELNWAPVRFDAIISSTVLSGFANLDGNPSEITLDLHSLESDQGFRDRYIRQRMFPGTQTATVTIERLPDLAQIFFDGEETSGTLEGSLQIGDAVSPLTFDVVARHDGSVINVLGKTTFTWDELGLTTPVAGPVVFLADEVRVQVLIVAWEQ